MKVHSSVTIESVLKEKAMEYRINISKLCETALEKRIAEIEGSQPEKVNVVQVHKDQVVKFYHEMGTMRAFWPSVKYLKAQGYSPKAITKFLKEWVAPSTDLRTVEYAIKLAQEAKQRD